VGGQGLVDHKGCGNHFFQLTILEVIRHVSIRQAMTTGPCAVPVSNTRDGWSNLTESIQVRCGNGGNEGDELTTGVFKS
jgi:hypothetical protein